MKPSPVWESSTFLNSSEIAHETFCSRLKYHNRDLTCVPEGLGMSVSYNQWSNKGCSSSTPAFGVKLGLCALALVGVANNIKQHWGWAGVLNLTISKCQNNDRSCMKVKVENYVVLSLQNASCLLDMMYGFEFFKEKKKHKWPLLFCVVSVY